MNKGLFGHARGLGIDYDVPAVRAYNAGSAQSISGSTFTAVTYDSHYFDTDGMHDAANFPSRLTCRTEGGYLIGANTEWGGGSPTNAEHNLKLNGTTYIARHNIVADYRYMIVPTFYYLVPGDYVEVEVWESAGSRTIQITANSSPEFWAVRVA